MTVSELIAKLAQLPADLPVRVEGEAYGESVDAAGLQVYGSNDLPAFVLIYGKG